MHRRLASIAILVVAACGAAKPAAPPAGSTAEPADELAALVQRLDAELRAEMPAAGATVAVAREGQKTRVFAVGLADLEQNVPATSDTVYCIGSISKTFAAVAVLQLVEDGKLALTDDVTKYLPEFPTSGHGITLHHLLHHESGLQDFEYEGTWPTTKAVARTKQQVVETFRDLPLEFAPGTRWKYSTSGYYLLGLVIEAASGKDYEDYLRERVFAPAGLTATRMCDPDDIIPHRARGYTIAEDGKSLANAELADLAQFGLGGGVCSTAGDLTRFWRALASGALVSPASFDLMRTPHALADGTPTAYGYGLFATGYRGRSAVGHSGGVPGFSAQLLTYPEAGISLAVLGNDDGSHALELERRLAEALVEFEPVAHQRVPASVDARIVGCYEFDMAPVRVEIGVEAGTARMRMPGGEPKALAYQGDETFIADGDVQQIAFAGGADRAARLVSTAYGMAFNWHRVTCDAPGAHE